MEQIKRIERKLKYRGVVLEFYEDKMLLPDGRTTNWDFTHHKGAAGCVAVLDDGRLLMTRQFRNPLNMDSLEIPAGGVDFLVEDPMVGAVRELEEETGYRAGKVDELMTIYTSIALSDEQIAIYLARDLVKTRQHLDDDEFLQVEVWTLDDLLDEIRSGHIRDSKTISAIYAYKDFLDRNK